MPYRSLLLIFIALLLFLQSHAQFRSAMVGVNGLTCSACSRSVEVAIRKLSFVKDVEMNLENTEGKIIFSDNIDVDIDKVAKAVVDAGFNVRYLTASFLFMNVNVSDGYCYNAGKYFFQFMKTGERSLNGESQIKFIGRNFMPKAEFNKWKPLPSSSCPSGQQKIYYVTLP